tara:strand:+ start:3010 stop:3132 length:123 start_codon:yes stop_codon:yes gene_type:complete
MAILSKDTRHKVGTWAIIAVVVLIACGIAALLLDVAFKAL